MIRLHDEIDNLAWKLVTHHKISLDRYYDIIESSNANFQTWLTRRFG